MPWFKVDDGLADHPKVIELADTRQYKAAIGLWCLAGSWCSKHLTDGAVPRAVVKRLGFTLTEAKALVACGMWHETDDGYQFHDWSPINPTRAEVEAQREKTAARVKRHRNKPRDDVGNASTQRVCNGVTNDAPIPTQPNPTQPNHPSGDRASEIRLGFARRYERARGLTWPSGKHDRETREVGAWFAANPSASAATALDNFFADPWCQSAGFPFGALAKDPAKYAAPPEKPDPEAQERERRAKREASIADIARQMRGES